MSSPHHHVLRFSASLADFERASAALREALDACALHGGGRHNAELIFEEVVSNVIRHGHTADDGGRTPQIDLSIACESDANAIVLIFEDDGPPFDPLERPLPTLPKTLADAPLGGLGLLLVRKASSGLRYERTPDQKNRLTVTIATG
jgi:anti-sigma regulatory factor (Ser/Thr protein kinase)